MNDTELLGAVRESFAGVHLDEPVERVVDRARAHRRRRLATVNGLAAVAVAAGLALVLSPTGQPPARPPGGVATTGSGVATNIQNAGFTLEVRPDGTVRLTWKELKDPKAVQDALAKAGVRAVVRIGPCRMGSGPTAPSIPPKDALSVLERVVRSHRDGNEFVTEITPSALPSGTELVFVYGPTKNQLTGQEDGLSAAVGILPAGNAETWQCSSR